VRACAYWSFKHKSISPPSLQLVKIPAAGALEEGGKGNGLESWLMLAVTGVGAVFHADM